MVLRGLSSWLKDSQVTPCDVGRVAKNRAGVASGVPLGYTVTWVSSNCCQAEIIGICLGAWEDLLPDWTND